MNYKNKYKISHVIACLVLISFPLEIAFSSPFSSLDKNSTVYVSVGQTSVEANELVIGQPPGYPQNYKLSHLTWEVNNNPVLIAGTSFSRGNMSLNLELQAALSEGDGVMDDYDWLVIGSDWSHWSHHADTSLTDHASVDLNLDYHFFGNNKHAWRFLAGYRQSNWAFEARGGSYIYSSIPGFRDLTGTFPGIPVISYEQEFSFPYIGIKYEGQAEKWKFYLQYEYSNWVSMTATDHHFLRDLIFVDDFNDGTMSAYKVAAAYKFSSGLEGFIRYDTRNYEELRGDTLTRDSISGTLVGYCENCAGADNSSRTLSLGISYSY